MPDSEPVDLQITGTRGDLPIIAGIGASAGGLDVLKRLFSSLQADTGICFVLIQHLDPTHESLMADLLANYTAMPVVQVTEETRVEPDHVYVIPPNKYLYLEDATLKLSKPVERRGMRMAIDFFFRSLAEACGEKAIGIILSGTGSDGTLGIKAIKEHGGIVLVQSPASAQYDGMPRSAINTGVVDTVLEVEDMAATLLRYVQHPYVKQQSELAETGDEADDLKAILDILHARARYDFRYYKQGTLLRRIQRRMGINQIDDFPDYVTLLREQPEEVSQLFKDMLIGVTRFFRDEEVFRELEQHVVDTVIRRVGNSDDIRVWVPGCSTGEEAYSIAMLFIERLRALDSEAKLQIFATDIDQQALETARNGIYPDSIAADVQADRLERFFVRVDEHSYQIEKAVRDVILFAPHNVLSNAPFSKLDLITCRNLLIYLQPEVQTRVIRLFHFALSASGFLLLGPSETIGRHNDLFETVSRKWRIYRRIGPVRHELVELPVDTVGRPRVSAAPREKGGAVTGYRELMQQAIINSFSPACALISRSYEILSVQGPLIDYLEFPPGELTRDLLAMARKGLRTRIRAAVHSALRSGSAVVDNDARVMRDGGYVPCTIQVRVLNEPGTESSDAEGLLLIAFSDRADKATGKDPGAELDDESSLIGQLEYELNSTREDLQSTIEEMESSNEELKASNEEIMSMNEELQSTNEELETSKEELQSLNEELSTVNSQLQDKVAELDKSNNDMINLLASTDIATIFLDLEKRIKRFTPAAGELLSLISADVGRRIGGFLRRGIDEQLLSDIDQVLNDLVSREREVNTEDGAWYLRRIVPYRTQDNHIEGVVVNFIEVTELKRIEAELQRFNESLEQQVEERSAEARLLSYAVEQSPASVIITDANAVIEYVNPAFERISGYSADEVRGQSPRLLQSGHTPRETFEDMWATLKAGETWRGEFCNQRKNGEHYWDRGYIAPVLDAGGRVLHYVSQQEDITQRKKVIKALQESEHRLRSLVDYVAEAIITVDKSNVILEFNPAAEQIFGYSAEQVRGRKMEQLLAGDTHTRIADGLFGEAGQWQEFTGRKQDGETFPIELIYNEVDHLGFYAVLIHDISLRRRLEREIIEATSVEQERIGHEIHDGIGQQLTGISMLTRSLLRKLEQQDTSSAITAASELMSHLEQTAEGVRKLSSGLSPINFTPDGLIPAISELVDSIQTSSGLACEFTCTGSVRVIDEFRALQIYRILQEAINNAIKHASATRVRVHLDGTDHGIAVSVEDDGKGINTAWDQNKGLGMHIMHYRADIIGASLAVEPREGGGTRLSCHCMKPGFSDGVL